ncbi:MAG: aminofutalosine synthase MqnE [Bacteroidales bacterium]
MDIKKKEISLLKSCLSGNRLSVNDALFLYKHASLAGLIQAAFKYKYQLYGKKVFYIQNVHIEPTNYCVYKCKFCSFHKEPNEQNFWEDDIKQIIEKTAKIPTSIKEIHITGGVHPHRDLYWYIRLLKQIKEIVPAAQIKAFTAIEIRYMCIKANISIGEGLFMLQKAGLDSLAGGGAEIFNSEIRNQLCPEKGDALLWLNVHKEAHKLGIVSNATMLYGHIEKIEHRIEHMATIRAMQDETNGFNCFIPLKFRNQQNPLSEIKELPFLEDVRLFAISRLFFDNIPHIKAYWPMIGRDKAVVLLNAGADDLDGTIYDSTKIYTLAGSEEQKPMISVEELKALIQNEKFIPVERDLFYKELS